jgi:serine/threonine-protein kinase
MLYEMLTGRKPFQADTSYSVLNAQLNEAPAPPAQWNPTIPAELNAIVLRAMAKDPSGRFQTADEFRNAIRAVREPKVEPVPAAVTMFEAVPATSWEPVSTHSPSSPGAPPMATQVISPTVFSPPVVAPAAQKSNRTLWITLGAVAAILVLAALATVLPRFFLTHAGQKTASVATDAQSSGSSPAQASAAGQTATQSAPSPQPDFAGTAMTSGKPARSSPPAGGNSSPQPVKVKQPQTTVSDQPANPTGQNPPPVNNSNPPAAQGPTPQQLREGHDRLINIDARADAARAGVQNIRSQQQAQGLDIRGDILASMTRMNRFLEEADHALSQRDLDSANDYMDRANTELARLESFLGR